MLGARGPGESAMSVEAGGTEKMVEVVRERYGRIAEGKESGCCGPTCCSASEAEDN